MATKRRTMYEKALRQLERAATDHLVAESPDAAERAQERFDRWYALAVQEHWHEVHQDDGMSCEWCRANPRLWREGRARN